MKQQRSIGRKAVIQLNRVPRNSKGGIQVKDEDIVAAFEFFGHKRGKLKRTDVIKTFNNLCKNITKKDVNILFSDKDEITIEEVKEFLENNTVVTDPVIDAFHVLDPTHCGYITEDRLKKIFANFGYGELDDEELKFLVQTGDCDGDGKITLTDFLKLARPEINLNPAKSGKGMIPDVEKLKRMKKTKEKQTKNATKIS
jgi:Ca2+-binding EF-hand superfamily protein